MAAAYVASFVNTTPGGANNGLVNITCSAHDTLVMWAETDETSATFTWPTGFVQIAGSPLTTTADSQRFAAAIKKDAAGTETALTVVPSGSVACIAGVAVFSGCDNTTQPDATPAAVNSNTTSTTAPTGSTTPVTAGAMIVALFGADVGSGATDPTHTFSTTSGTTGAWTTRQDQHSGFYNAALGTALQAAAGAITITCTRSATSAGAMFVIALRPAAGGGGGTAYFKTVGGTITASGNVIRKVKRPLSGSITVSGVVVKKARRSFGGTLIPSGVVTKKSKVPLSGSITPSGSLSERMVLRKALAGTITASGTIGRKVKKRVLGAITASGSLTKKTRRALSGSITASGALLKKTKRKVAGSIAASGSLVARLVFRKSVSGSITASGAVARLLVPFVPAGAFVASAARTFYSFMNRR